jgi:hypothetical protein
LVQQIVWDQASRQPVHWLIATATIDSPRCGSPHFRRVRDAVSSYLGAEVGCIGA